MTITATMRNSTITLKNNVPSVSQNYVHKLLDVVEVNPANGYTLLYNETLKKYVVGPVVAPDLNLDGGTF